VWGRSFATITVGLTAAVLIFLWHGTYAAIEHSRSIESLMGRLDREVIEVHADIRARLAWSEPVDEVLGRTAARVERMLESIRATNVAITAGERLAAAGGRLLGGGFEANLDVDGIARAHSAYRTEVVAAEERAVAGETDVERRLDLQMAALKQAIAGARQAASKRSTAMLSAVDAGAQFVIGFFAITLVYVLWRWRDVAAPPLAADSGVTSL
jgi:hypothetical protein